MLSKSIAFQKLTPISIILQYWLKKLTSTYRYYFWSNITWIYLHNKIFWTECPVNTEGDSILIFYPFSHNTINHITSSSYFRISSDDNFFLFHFSSLGQRLWLLSLRYHWYLKLTPAIPVDRDNYYLIYGNICNTCRQRQTWSCIWKYLQYMQTENSLFYTEIPRDREHREYILDPINYI